MEPSGPTQDRLNALFTDKSICFIGFGSSNDKKQFLDLMGIRIVETRGDAGITDVNPNGDPDAMTYIDMQMVVHRTWAEDLAGYNVMKNNNNMPGLAVTAIACGSMENMYRQLVGILVTVIEQASAGPVRNMDELLLDLYDETRSVPYFEQLLNSNQADQQIYKKIQFGGGQQAQGMATPQTHVMAALKIWHSKFGLSNRFEVLIGGVRYSDIPKIDGPP